MKRCGIIVATIASGLCCLMSIFMIMFGWLTASSVQYINTHSHDVVNNEYSYELELLAANVEQESLFEEMKRHGIIGAITSFITFVACFITLPSMRFLFPSIAAGSALVGGIFSGWLILCFMAIALVGVGLIAYSHHSTSKTAKQSA